jgi:S-(hydroxymethyl)glutathione dehydrogenase/alcohol dehydrogenase
MECRAAVLVEQGDKLQVRTVDIGEPQTGEVIVRIRAAGVCHSDLSICDGTLPFATPTVPGHEASGEVVELGPGVTRVRVGDRVILSFIAACGDCFHCVRGEPYLCSASDPLDVKPKYTLGDEGVYQSLTSAFAEYTRVPEHSCVPLRGMDDVSFEVAALVSCAVMTGVGAALNTAKVEPGSSVAVLGCGGVGLNIVQGARIAGATEIIAVDTSEAKLETARAFGATDAVRADLSDATDAVVARSPGGRGVDYAFEAVGRSTTIEQTIAMVRRGGTAVIVGAGSFDDLATQTALSFTYAARKVIGSCYGSANVDRDFPRLLEFHRRGLLDIESLISERIGLGDIDDAFARMRAGIGSRSVVLF